MLQSENLDVWRIRQRPDGIWVVEEKIRERRIVYSHDVEKGEIFKGVPWEIVWEQQGNSFRSRRRARKAALRYKNPKIEII